MLPVRVHEFGRQNVLRAAETKMKFAVSYADAFAVALAQALDVTILTGDPEINAIFMLRFLARPAQCEHSARTLLRVDATRFDVEGART